MNVGDQNSRSVEPLALHLTNRPPAWRILTRGPGEAARARAAVTGSPPPRGWRRNAPITPSRAAPRQPVSYQPGHRWFRTRRDEEHVPDEDQHLTSGNDQLDNAVGHCHASSRCHARDEGRAPVVRTSRLHRRQVTTARLRRDGSINDRFLRRRLGDLHLADISVSSPTRFPQKAWTRIPDATSLKRSLGKSRTRGAIRSPLESDPLRTSLAGLVRADRVTPGGSDLQSRLFEVEFPHKLPHRVV